MTERAPRGPLAALDEANRTGNRTGGARQQVANAGPLPTKKSAVGEALAALAATAETGRKIDQFTLAADGAQDLTLTYLPVEDSWNVMIRRSPAFMGDDYTVSGQTLSIINGEMTPLTGDKVQIQYDYYVAVATAPTGEWPGLVASLGPLAWWRLGDVSNGGTMTDSSGHGHHGTWNAVTSHTATSSLVAGDSDDALNMTGAGGEGATVSYGSWMNQTQMSWVFLVDSTDTSARVIARESGLGGLTYVWSVQMGSNIIFLASGAVVATSTATVNDGSTHLIVITYDGATVDIYVDGDLNTSVAYSTALPTPTNTGITVGYGGGTTTSHMFSGEMDEQILFDRALNATEVTALWAAAT